MVHLGSKVEFSLHSLTGYGTLVRSHLVSGSQWEELARSVAFRGWSVDPWGFLRPFQGFTRSKLFSDNTKALLVFLTELMFALKM